MSGNVEVTIYAYIIKGVRDGKEIILPNHFFSLISALRPEDLWDNQSLAPNAVGHLLVNKSFKDEGVKNGYTFSAKFVVAKNKTHVTLINLAGVAFDHQLPESPSITDTIPFTIHPSFNLLICKGININTELNTYLNYLVSHKYNEGVTPAEKFDSITISAIPVEDDPVGFLRKNPNLGSFEAYISAKEFQKEQYGFMKDIIDGIDTDEERLYIKIEIGSRKRKEPLPTIMIDRLGNFLEGVDEDNLQNVKARLRGEKHTTSASKLLGAVQHKKIYINKDQEDLFNEIVDYAKELIDEIGDEILNPNE